MQEPVVTVVMAAYNAAGYIRRAIESVQAQTLSDWEIVVADDASTDDTVAVVHALAAVDPRIRCLTGASNAGPSAARNRAIRAARGRWVAVLDSDDAYLPERLETLVGAGEAESADIVADNYLLFDDSLKKTVGVAYSSQIQRVIGLSEFVGSAHPLKDERLALLKPVVRRDILLRTGTLYPEGIRYSEDFHFFATLLLWKAKALYVPKPLYLYSLPVSHVTGAKSGGSRTVPRLGDRIWTADDLLRHPAVQTDPRARAQLARYRRWSVNTAEGQKAWDALKSGRVAEAFWTSLVRPGAALTYGVTSRPAKRIRRAVQKQLGNLIGSSRSSRLAANRR